MTCNTGFPSKRFFTIFSPRTGFFSGSEKAYIAEFGNANRSIAKPVPRKKEFAEIAPELAVEIMLL
jgi:hypothetical protein